MNASELARLMLYWEDQKNGLARTEERIKEAVLELGRTVDTGNVRASYSKGRTKYDYVGYINTALKDGRLLEDDMVPFEKVTVDYRSVYQEFFEGTALPFTQSDPSVTVKLL